MSKVLVLNGPNLNLIGLREPHIYGSRTLADLELLLEQSAPEQMDLIFYQSNHEGEMIDRVHSLMSHSVNGIVINAGAWTHTSIALRDALSAVRIPFIEVHISNIYAREAFRHHSYLSDSALAVISGCGLDGYIYALMSLHQHLKG